MMKRVLVFVLILTGTAFAFAQNPQALILEMTGTVELKTGGSADWAPANPGDRIEKSTIISTGFKSTALLEVGSSIIVVRPLTRLSLEDLMSQGDTETVNIGLRTGRIQVEVKPPAGGRSEFTVQSPTSTASVRGTRFDLDTVNLKVIEGTVRFESTAAQGRSVLVNAGQSSQIDTGTGQAVNPLVQAETERRLPALAGESYIPAARMADSEKPESGGSITVKPVTD